MISMGANSFVLFPLGKKRFALPSDSVAELARPDSLQTFPHTTPLLAGVLLRRGRIVPVCDIAPVLIGPGAPARKFYLIATRRFGSASEWTAIPVTGECELTSANLLPRTGKLPAYVAGLLSLEKDIIEVLDLEKLMAGEARRFAETQS
ncbi:MAG: chemotaxis protein CheW [Terriglobales bacterium]